MNCSSGWSAPATTPTTSGRPFERHRARFLEELPRERGQWDRYVELEAHWTALSIKHDERAAWLAENAPAVREHQHLTRDLGAHAERRMPQLAEDPNARSVLGDAPTTHTPDLVAKAWRTAAEEYVRVEQLHGPGFDPAGHVDLDRRVYALEQARQQTPGPPTISF